MLLISYGFDILRGEVSVVLSFMDSVMACRCAQCVCGGDIYLFMYVASLSSSVL